jgi:branched-chain amino acid transport system ATP-binding protein
MLDEPSMGLSPIMTQTIMRTILKLQSEGVTILLVEQNASAALSLADRGYVLEVGQIMFSDTGKALLGDDRVRKAYLGAD